MAETTDRCADSEHRQLDFWLGSWDLTWPGEQTGGDEGEVGTGTNRITRMFDNCVIEENFSTADGSFRGHSVSIYDPRTEQWHQTWVDNQGGHLVFTGGPEGDTFILHTEPADRDGEVVVQRMVFSSITEASISWNWQGSRDGGVTWNDLWNISYTRAS